MVKIVQTFNQHTYKFHSCSRIEYSIHGVPAVLLDETLGCAITSKK